MKAKLFTRLLIVLSFLVSSSNFYSMCGSRVKTNYKNSVILLSSTDGDYKYEIVYINGERWVFVYNNDGVLVDQYREAY